MNTRRPRARSSALALCVLVATLAVGSEARADSTAGAGAGPASSSPASPTAKREEERRARMKLEFLERARKDAIQSGDAQRRRELEAMISSMRDRSAGAAPARDARRTTKGRRVGSSPRRHRSAGVHVPGGAHTQVHARTDTDAPASPGSGAGARDARTIRIRLPSNSRGRNASAASPAGSTGCAQRGKTCASAPGRGARPRGASRGTSRNGRMSTSTATKKNLFTSQAQSVSPRVKPPGR